LTSRSSSGTQWSCSRTFITTTTTSSPRNARGSSAVAPRWASSSEAELDAWWETFRVSDPLDYRPGAHRIVQYFRRAEPKASADLDWDVEAGTVRVQLYDSCGNESTKLSFETTVAGIEAAIAAIVAVFTS